jgi:hypothetical protein
MALVRKAANEIPKDHDFLFKSLGIKKINELVITSNKLKNNFVGLVAVGLVLDVARGQPDIPRIVKIVIQISYSDNQSVSQSLSLSTSQSNFLQCPGCHNLSRKSEKH